MTMLFIELLSCSLQFKCCFKAVAAPKTSPAACLQILHCSLQLQFFVQLLGYQLLTAF